jgi:hypothetical protein
MCLFRTLQTPWTTLHLHRSYSCTALLHSACNIIVQALVSHQALICTKQPSRCSDRLTLGAGTRTCQAL